MFTLVMILAFLISLLCVPSSSLNQTALVGGVLWDKNTKVGGALPGPLGQLCCKFNAQDVGIKNEPVEVSLPHPLNDSSTILIGCSTLMSNSDKNGYCSNCKEYAACNYCTCLYRAGGAFN
jgi:hypothetical protein